MKRILTIQDISCIGKCSLTVALPILSAMGTEACVIPTAVLSTHTSFKGFTFRDLTQDIQPISNHWVKEKITFDAIYTGYLGSKEQVDLVSNIFDTYKKADTLIFVDPAMADNGKLYAGFTEDFAQNMARLCTKADVIVPNLTEACYMLGIPYMGEDYTKAEIETILKDLSKLGAKKVVLTGISFHKKELGVMAYDSVTDEFFSYYNQKVEHNYHGTGDIFASVCVGAMMRGYSLEDALKLAVDFTLECILKTEEDPNHRWYGVNFETAIPLLIHRLEDNDSDSNRVVELQRSRKFR